ncbi:MAG TPA: VacJ family lipoprotein, partial [Gammaproteobacteria bacterium]|nr:VacJ family lipoprotein [Gammaproteobacteria bacterium]
MLNHSFLKIILSFGLSLILLSGCSYQNVLTNDEKDPLEAINRNFYAFNDNLDKIIVEPTADGYDFVTPNAFQIGVNNFFDNFQYPITIANQLLQGNIKLASQDTLRLIINSTIGLAGLFDPAKNMGFTKHDEDFGQTLAVWGVGEGPYLMLPFL